MLHNQIRTVVTTTLLSATVALVPAAVRAQDQPLDKRTILTFSGPVELPGVALQPGQYVFRLADPTTSRKMIQVVSVDGKQVYGTFFSIPIEMPEAPSKPEVRLMEPAPGSPAAVRAYWYPNERIGSEFIYPREQAMRLAKSAKAPVLTTTASSSKVDESNSGDLARVSGTGQSSAANGTANSNANSTANSANSAANSNAATSQRLGQDPVGANTPSQSAASSNATSQRPGSATPGSSRLGASTPGSSTPGSSPRQMAQNRTALPQTASSRPAVAMLGMLALALACAMRAWSTRIN